MLFFLLINVKLPTIVGILTLMSRKNFMHSRVEHEIFFITSGGLISLINTMVELHFNHQSELRKFNPIRIIAVHCMKHKLSAWPSG